MVRRDGQSRVTSSAKFGGQSQGGLGSVNKVIVADVIKAAVIDEKSIASASAKLNLGKKSEDEKYQEKNQ